MSIVTDSQGRAHLGRARLLGYSAKIHLSASNEESELWRLTRLAVAAGAAAQRLATAGRYELTDAIELLAGRLAALHDHKGELAAHWRVRPTAAEQRLLATVWASLGERRRHVVHTWPDGRLAPVAMGAAADPLPYGGPS